MKKITTHEELKKLHGRKITCEINGEKIDDAKISVDNQNEHKIERILICQNEISGGHDVKKIESFNYTKAWVISSVGTGGAQTFEEDNRGAENIYLVESDILQYQATFKAKVKNLNDVFFSITSSEEDGYNILLNGENENSFYLKEKANSKTEYKIDDILDDTEKIEVMTEFLLKITSMGLGGLYELDESTLVKLKNGKVSELIDLKKYIEKYNSSDSEIKEISGEQKVIEKEKENKSQKTKIEKLTKSIEEKDKEIQQLKKIAQDIGKDLTKKEQEEYKANIDEYVEQDEENIVERVEKLRDFLDKIPTKKVREFVKEDRSQIAMIANTIITHEDKLKITKSLQKKLDIIKNN